MIRTIALSLLVGAVAADPALTEFQATVLKTFDAIGSSAAFRAAHPDLAKRHRDRRFLGEGGDGNDDDDDTCAPNMAAYPGGMQAIMTFQQGECASFISGIGEAFGNPSPESYENFCQNECLVPTMRIMRNMAATIPDTSECQGARAMTSSMSNLIPSLICARNHLGIRCGAVLLAATSLQSEAEDFTAGTINSSNIGGSDQADASLYGLTLNDAQRADYAGDCGRLEAAGCCMRSTFATFLGLMNAHGDSNTANAATLADVETGLRLARTQCAAAGRPSNNIGALACPMATVRNGGMPSGDNVAGAPAALAVRRRLRLTFDGDLTALSAAKKTALKASIKNTVERAMGAGSVVDVILTAGSINAEVVFASDVTADEVSALTSDVSIVQMAPDDGTGTSLAQSSSPSTVDEADGSTPQDSAASAALPTALGLAGLVAAALMM